MTPANFHTSPLFSHEPSGGKFLPRSKRVRTTHGTPTALHSDRTIKLQNPRRGNAPSCRLLVEEGKSKLDCKDEGGDTALHEAARADELEVLVTLLDLGADVDARNKLGATPLLVASHKGHKAICKALIAAGAAVTGTKSMMRGGYSPLHAAAANGSTDCLQDLIDAGASLRHSASESSLRGGSATALELAEGSGQRGAASMLRNASVTEFEKYGMWGNPRNNQ